MGGAGIPTLLFVTIEITFQPSKGNMGRPVLRKFVFPFEHKCFSKLRLVYLVTVFEFIYEVIIFNICR